MFGFFKRKRTEDWEIEFIKELSIKFFGHNSEYYKQVLDGIIKGVLLDMSDIPNYIGFTYNSEVYNKFFDEKVKNFSINNIKVINLLNNSILDVSVYFCFGIVNGYAVTGKEKKFKFDTSTINITDANKVLIGDNEKTDVLSFFSTEELNLINESNIYSTVINKILYHHIKELEDGEFIGIDSVGELFKITHDPLEVKKISKTEFLNFLKQ